MRFAFTDDAAAFRDAVRDLLAKECPPTAVRVAWTNDDRPRGSWACSAELGVLGGSFAEADGGLGPTTRPRAAARGDGPGRAPEPVVEHAVVALRPHDAHAGAATGDAPSRGSYADLVPYADDRRPRAARRPALVAAARRRSAAPVGRRSRRLFDVEPGSRPGRPSALAERRDSRSPLARSHAPARRAAPTPCSSTTVEYANEREQFGVPIGSFQAVKHHLADAALALEFARPLVYRAAWSSGDTATAEPAGARVDWPRRTRPRPASLAARMALQVHGAIGYTHEYDLHLWMKRAWALAAAWGDAAWHRSPRRTTRSLTPTPSGAVMPEAYIVDAVRTPVGRGRRPVARSTPPTSAPTRSTRSCDRTGIDPAAVEDVMFGCVDTIGPQAGDIARTCWLAAGLPERRARARPSTASAGRPSRPSHFAAQAVMSGTNDVVVAGGVQNMSMIPIASAMTAAEPLGFTDPFSGSEGWVERYGTQEVVAVPRRRDDRREVGHLPRGHGALRASSRHQRGHPGHRRGPLRQRDRARSATSTDRRGPPPRHDAREDGDAARRSSKAAGSPPRCRRQISDASAAHARRLASRR